MEVLQFKEQFEFGDEPVRASQQSFMEPAREVSASLRTDRILNYVWLNWKKAKSVEDGGSMANVPLHYMDKAFENARRYPDTEVLIWVDYAKINPESKFFMESHVYINGPSNVRLKDLNDLACYRDCEVFHDAEKPHTLATQVDLARFMVLSHCLSTRPVNTAFYADFDMEDVQLDNIKTQLVLAAKGIAYAAVDAGQFYGKILQHGYIAVHRSGQRQLDGVIIPVLTDAGLARERIFDSLEAVTFRCADPLARMEMLPTVTTDVPVHKIGYLIPVPELYKETGLCMPRLINGPGF